MVNSLIVVVDSNRQNLLGMALTNHVVIENLENLRRRRNAFARLHERGFVFLADDLHAELDAFIADEHGRPRNKLADFVLALSAEGAIEGVLGLAPTRLAHSYSSKIDPGLILTRAPPRSVAKITPGNRPGAKHPASNPIRSR